MHASDPCKSCTLSSTIYAVHIHQTACKNKQIKVITVAPKLSIVYSSQETVRTWPTVLCGPDAKSEEPDKMTHSISDFGGRLRA